MSHPIDPQSPDDADVERLLRLGAPDCVDEAGIDHAELLARARGRAAPDVDARVHRHLLACSYCGAIEAEYRRMHAADVRRQRLRLFALAASIVVLVLGGLLLRGLSSPVELREYAVARVRGQVAEVMSPTASDLAEPWRFVGDSPIEILLRPVEETSRAMTPAARVFVVEGDRLVARPTVRAVFEGDPSYPVLRVRATGRELFGTTAAARQLVIGFGESDADVAALEGRTLTEARTTAKLHVFAIDYRADGAR